jgi:hypothetical protein
MSASLSVQEDSRARARALEDSYFLSLDRNYREVLVLKEEEKEGERGYASVCGCERAREGRGFPC